MKVQAIICIFLAGTIPARSQLVLDSHSAAARAAQADPWAQLPVTTLTFSHTAELSGLPQSPFIMNPLQCTPRGALFFQIPLPPKFMTRAFVFVTAKGKMTVDADAANVPGFEEFRQLEVFPRDEHVYGIVEGRHRPPGQPPNEAGEQPPWGEFVVEYAAEGSIESLIPLTQISFTPMKFGVLPSGRLVLAGKDLANLAPVLVMLDRAGNNPYPLDLFGSQFYSTQRLSQFYPEVGHDNPAGTGIDRVLSSVQFVSYGNNLLVVQTGTNFPVAEIGDGGILRTVPLELPAGTMIESLLPASQHAFYVRIADRRAEPVIHRLIVFDPNTGEALREIRVSGLSSPGFVACESGNTFLGLGKGFKEGSDNGVWSLMTASE
jgi:hypothetical protein